MVCRVVNRQQLVAARFQRALDTFENVSPQLRSGTAI